MAIQSDMVELIRNPTHAQMNRQAKVGKGLH